jgi:hypothetical protein
MKPQNDYKWQVTLKGGASFTLDVVAGEEPDTELTHWLDNLVDGKERFLELEIGDTKVWFRSSELGMACRSKIDRFIPLEDTVVSDEGCCEAGTV